MTNKPNVPLPPGHVDPLTTIWSAGRRLYRVHPAEYAPNEFHPGTGDPSGRFHPIHSVQGDPIPTLYASDRIHGALSETVFRNIVAGGVILRAELATRCLAHVELVRDIAIADLSGHGLRRLGLDRSQLLETSARSYAYTARWAEAIHRSNEIVDGINWVSRQFDTAKALLAFGDRLKQDDFAVIGAPERLDRGRGYRRVQEAASAAGITIAEG